MLTVTSGQLEAWLAMLLFPFMRFAALCSSAPLLSNASVPRRVRLGLALLLTAVVAPTLPPPPPVALGSAAGLLCAAEQVLIGLVLGFTMQLAFAAVTLAGDVVGLQMGLSFASLVDPQNAEQSPLLGSFLTIVLMLLLVAGNGHLAMIDALATTFRTLPVAAPAGTSPFDWHHLAATATLVFASGLMLAIPLIAVLLLASFALGMLTRTAPQLNLFAVGFPLTLGIGLVGFVLALPYLVPAMTELLVTLDGRLAR